MEQKNLNFLHGGFCSCWNETDHVRMRWLISRQGHVRNECNTCMRLRNAEGLVEKGANSRPFRLKQSRGAGRSLRTLLSALDVSGPRHVCVAWLTDVTLASLLHDSPDDLSHTASSLYPSPSPLPSVTSVHSRLAHSVFLPRFAFSHLLGFMKRPHSQLYRQPRSRKI